MKSTERKYANWVLCQEPLCPIQPETKCCASPEAAAEAWNGCAAPCLPDVAHFCAAYAEEMRKSLLAEMQADRETWAEEVAAMRTAITAQEEKIEELLGRNRALQEDGKVTRFLRKWLT